MGSTRASEYSAGRPTRAELAAAAGQTIADVSASGLYAHWSLATLTAEFAGLRAAAD